MSAKIVTDFIHPSIPLRKFDWVAFRDGNDEDGPFGRGKTELEAIAELMLQEEEEHESRR